MNSPLPQAEEKKPREFLLVGFDGKSLFCSAHPIDNKKMLKNNRSKYLHVVEKFYADSLEAKLKELEQELILQKPLFSYRHFKSKSEQLEARLSSATSLIEFCMGEIRDKTSGCDYLESKSWQRCTDWLKGSK